MLKSNSIRVTPQRLGVYKLLREEKRHFSAEEVYAKVKNHFPAISLATVYSILELLKEKDLASEVRINLDKASFEAKKNEHHHFLCKKCGEIFDIHIELCPTLKRRETQGHSIDKFQGYFYGVCKNCRGK